MKKKLLFKNSTKYSKKLYDEFTYFHNTKYFLTYEIFTLFIIILLSYCVFSTIKVKLAPLAIFFIIVLILFMTYRILGPTISYKKELKNKSITKEQTFEFFFYDKYFKIRDNKSYDKISYFRLYRVYETPKYFYLYLTKKYSFVIDKNGFSMGNAEDFKTFIKKKMKFKYSKYDEKSAV